MFTDQCCFGKKDFGIRLACELKIKDFIDERSSLVSLAYCYRNMEIE